MSVASLGPAIPQLPTGDIDVSAAFVDHALGFEMQIDDPYGNAIRFGERYREPGGAEESAR